MNKVRYTQAAQKDLTEAWLFIAEDNLAAADLLIDKIEQDIDKLAAYPQLGRLRAELAQDLRSWPTTTPYIVFYYLPDDSSMTIIRVLHHSRDIDQHSFVSDNHH